MIYYNSKDNWLLQYEGISKFVREWFKIKSCQNDIQNQFLPLALLKFYKDYSNHFDKLFKCNKITKIDELSEQKGKIIFFSENQGVYLWQMDTSEENPIIFISENVSPLKWLPEEEKFCGFIYQMLMYEAMVNSKYYCVASWIDIDSLNLILKHWEDTPFKFMNWPAYPAKFYCADQAIAIVYPNENAFSFQCGSNDSQSLKFMKEFIDNTWEAVNIS